MSRNSGTNVYSPPPNITAVSGAPIESADWNAFVQDVTSTFNAPWPVGLGGTGVTSSTGYLATLGGLPLSGGTLTGPITLSGDATASLQPVTKQQFDAGLSGKASTTVTDALSSGKQATLVSGVNIKTINGQSVLGGGNLTAATKFTSAEAPFPSAAQEITISHNLGARPDVVVVEAVCKVAEYGFSVGDRVLLSTYNYSGFACQIRFDNASVFVSSGNAGLALRHKTTFGEVSFSPANWRLIVNALIV